MENLDGEHYDRRLKFEGCYYLNYQNQAKSFI